MLTSTFVSFSYRKVLKTSQTPNEVILSINLLFEFEFASYSVMLLGDHALFNIPEKLLWRSEESSLVSP